MPNKHNLVLYVDQELIEKSRELGFNPSKTFENHLKHLLMQLSHANPSNNTANDENVGDKWAGPDLNRRPLARKANVLTKLDDRPAELAYSVCSGYFLLRYIAAWSFSLVQMNSDLAPINLASSCGLGA
jgi:hypothetical protein